jgi:ribosomal protein S18 acetylase RimI-like enzyme
MARTNPRLEAGGPGAGGGAGDGVELVAGDAVAPQRLHATVLAAFADYLAGPFTITPQQWPSFLGRQGVDLGASRVALRGGEPVAFALACPRADNGRWRLAVMGALPAARGSGAAPALLDDFIARGRAAAPRGLELECFARNERARRLYASRGFEPVAELHGWTLAPEAPLAAPAGAPPRRVELATAVAWLDAVARRLPDLPLGVTSTPLAAATRPLSAWQRGGAQLVFSAVEGTPVQVHSLVDDSSLQDDALALVRALRASFAGSEIVVPALQREDLGGAALRRAGFAPQALHQVLMVRRG